MENREPENVGTENVETENIEVEKTNQKKHVWRILAVVALGVLLLGLVGYLILDKTIWKKEGGKSDDASPTQEISQTPASDNQAQPSASLSRKVEVYSPAVVFYAPESYYTYKTGNSRLFQEPNDLHNGHFLVWNSKALEGDLRLEEITQYLSDRLFFAGSSYFTMGKPLNVEYKQTQALEIAGIEMLRYEGAMVYSGIKDEAQRAEGFVVGYSFILDGYACQIISVSNYRENVQENEEAMKIQIDEVIKTLVVES